jgi:hypothetical protein
MGSLSITHTAAAAHQMSCLTATVPIYRYGMLLLRRPANGSLLTVWTQFAGKFEIRSGILRYVGFHVLHVLHVMSSSLLQYSKVRMILKRAYFEGRALILGCAVDHDVVRSSSSAVLSHDRDFH